MEYILMFIVAASFCLAIVGMLILTYEAARRSLTTEEGKKDRDRESSMIDNAKT